jgi:hypothetical protein
MIEIGETDRSFLVEQAISCKERLLVECKVWDDALVKYYQDPAIIQLRKLDINEYRKHRWIAENSFQIHLPNDRDKRTIQEMKRRLVQSGFTLETVKTNRDLGTLAGYLFPFGSEHFDYFPEDPDEGEHPQPYIDTGIYAYKEIPPALVAFFHQHGSLWHDGDQIRWIAPYIEAPDAPEIDYSALTNDERMKAWWALPVKYLGTKTNCGCNLHSNPPILNREG